LAPLALPNDRPRRPGASKSDHLTIEVPKAVAERLASLGRDEKTSAYGLLLAAFGICLNRYTGQNDLAVCSPMACRDKSELEPMIGYFNNVVAMRLDLSGDPDIREVIRRTRRTVISALDHQHLPLQKLAEIPDLARLTLTRGMFSFQDVSSRTLSLPGLSAEPIELRKPEADFEISLYMESTGAGNLTGILEYDAGLFDRRTIEGLARDFQAVLQSISADPDRALSALPRYGIDTSEITAGLKEHAQIDNAIVIHRTDGPGTLAYLVLNEHDVPKISDIRRFVRERFPDYVLPAAFTPLDELPLAEDGSIDCDALPVPDLLFKRSEDQPYVAPRNDLERQLCNIWKRVLWLESDVGIHDTFSDLGGHSLLAVQLVLTIEEELSRPVPTRALLQLSTIAEMAEILESGVADEDYGSDATPHHLSAEVYRGLRTYTSTWEGYRANPDSLIVGMNVDGTRRRLFWCLQRYGELTQLAKYIGEDQPVFGMRSGNSVMVKTQENINALAAHYVDEILGIQPEGPYLIGGNCQAAKIAFQVARQLQERGHEIELLMLMEKFVPQSYQGRIANIYGIDSHRNPHLHYRDPVTGWAKYFSGPLSLDLVKGRHSQFFKEPNIQDLAARIRFRIDEAAAGVVAGAGAAEAPTARQTLPISAYRAELKTLGAPSGKPGTKTAIPVQITNRSSTVWRSHEASGIFLASRWLNRKGKVVVPLDGNALLCGDLAPGDSETLEIGIKLPDRPGRYTLELDLVDDGVTWFAEEGSDPVKINLDIGNPPALTRFEGWWHNFISGVRNRFS
jgi:thioesterase domain-containing protein/acyl carrier protein